MIGVYQTKGVELSGPCGSKWSKHVSGEGGGHLISIFVAVGIQRPWTQPGGGWFLHILDTLLQSLATRSVSTLHYERIILIHSLL
jgi:hypothetical protein